MKRVKTEKVIIASTNNENFSQIKEEAIKLMFKDYIEGMD